MLKLIQTHEGKRYVLNLFGHFVPEGGTGRDAPATFDRVTAEHTLANLAGCPGPVVIEDADGRPVAAPKFTQEQAAAMQTALKAIAAFPNARKNLDLTLTDAVDEMAKIARLAVKASVT